MKQLRLVDTLFKSFEDNKSRNAFCVSGSFYSYDQLLKEISIHRVGLQEIDSNIIGVVANDDLQTYASLFAIWFEGKAVIPINPNFPVNYNEKIVKDVAITSYFDSLSEIRFDNVEHLSNLSDYSKGINSAPIHFSSAMMAYLLFTSGSTGEPKGVPITYEKLELFLDSHELEGIELNAEDRCLQMFDLTFDLSFVSFILPLLSGACVYTIPKNEIKYAYIFKLLSEEKLTFALMVPSVLSFLNQITEPSDCESLRYSLFCGEALELNLAKEWSEIALNAKIFNVYGPTEATIYCTSYKLEKEREISEVNGIVSIGHPMKSTLLILVDENGNRIQSEESGEICIGGRKITNGYWGNKHQDSFFEIDGERFYKTGDIGVIKKDGLLYFLGRSDSQVKVQGYRVELLEVEHKIKKLLKGKNALVFSYQMQLGGLSLGLVIESASIDTKDLIRSINLELPNHMMPTRIEFFENFPLNMNGKLDRKLILNQLGI